MGTAITRDNRTFVPISYIEKHFNVNVRMNEAAEAIYISQIPNEDNVAPTQMQGDYIDQNAIVAAWRNGDRTGLTSGLSPMNREVLARAVAILQEIGIEGMTDTQIKRALYNWFAANVTYDRQFLNNAPGARPNPNSSNAHGALISGTAICYGYAYAYQLFMDILGIGGVTVHGMSPTGSHAWNLVNIDGNWHVVDVPWRLINVSSQYMWNRGFRWDRNSIPEAR
jgi:transglutaminase/protease-like cytokinesis protein 3